MTKAEQIVALLRAIDARLARIERAMNSGPAGDQPIYVGTPPVNAVVIPLGGTANER
jgi:hypothetical protein